MPLDRETAMPTKSSAARPPAANSPSAKPPVRAISPTRRPAPSNGTRDAARTRRNLLDAAYHEFSKRGFHATTVEQICTRAGVSKQILSHHFGSKEGAHLAVLEEAYASARSADAITAADLESDPADALRGFVETTFDYLTRNRAFVGLQADENVNRGRHIRKSTVLPAVYDPLLDRLGRLLRNGEARGAFRPGLDPRQLYISISALCYFYFSNAYTLSAVFATDLLDKEAIAARRAHVVAFVMAAVRP